MRPLTKLTFDRPKDLSELDNPAVLYARSFLLTRTVVGVIGMLLPLMLIAAEAFYLRGGVHVRGSLSAYYHTSVRDIFVGALCVNGILLASYMSAQTNTADFWLSLLAGISVLGVVFFPTSRPNLGPEDPRCGIVPIPDGCAAIQQLLTEHTAAIIHFACAMLFIVSLGVLCFLFANPEREKGAALRRLLRGCGWLIFGALAWIGIGTWADLAIWELTPLYIGELLSVWAFGVAWLVKGRDLWLRLAKGRGSRPPAAAPS